MPGRLEGHTSGEGGLLGWRYAEQAALFAPQCMLLLGH